MSVRGMNITAIDEYGFACPHEEIIGVNLEQRLSFQTVEEFSLFMPVAIDDVFAWAKLVPIGAKWQSFVAMDFTFLQRTAHCLIHFSHLVNFVL
ncbi:hypothetical protein D3C77_551710 [compost metagenome]